MRARQEIKGLSHDLRTGQSRRWNLRGDLSASDRPRDVDHYLYTRCRKPKHLPIYYGRAGFEAVLVLQGEVGKPISASERHGVVKRHI